jgi:HSP20 family protein
MTISSRNKTNELVTLGDAIGRLIEDSLIWPLALTSHFTGSGTIPLDVYEEGNNLVVKASLPGIKPEDLNIEVRENVLTVSGETKLETERKGKDFLLNERRYGQFRRSVALPYDIKVDKVEAEFEDGILTLTLPKAETTKGKKISVKQKAKADKPKAKADK